MTGFLSELAKHGSFKDIVHHPATQAIGYAALAGEGAHLLAEMGKFGPRAKRFATKTKVGRGAGVGALAGGTAFLASEALAALGDVFGRKRKKKKGKFQGDVIIKVQPPDPKVPKMRFGSRPKMKATSLRKLTKAIGFKR
jgi:hypothetical protein